MATLNFDASTVQPQMGFELIPAAWYNAKIMDSEMKPTKDGMGSYLELKFQIIDGQYANRVIFTRLNLQNQNVQAKEIAYKQLSAIAHSVGVIHVAQSEQLHGIPLMIKVKVRPAKGDYEESNEISSYKAMETAAGALAAPAGFAAPTGFAAPQQAQQAAPVAEQPWGATTVQQPVQTAQQAAPVAAQQAPATGGAKPPWET